MSPRVYFNRATRIAERCNEESFSSRTIIALPSYRFRGSALDGSIRVSFYGYGSAANIRQCDSQRPEQQDTMVTSAIPRISPLPRIVLVILQSDGAL